MDGEDGHASIIGPVCRVSFGWCRLACWREPPRRRCRGAWSGRMNSTGRRTRRRTGRSGRAHGRWGGAGVYNRTGMSRIVWLVSIGLLAGAAQAQMSWRLEWADEFDGPKNSAPDGAKWTRAWTVRMGMLL